MKLIIDAQFTGSCKKGIESSCTLHQVPSNGYILHKCSMIDTKTMNWYWSVYFLLLCLGMIMDQTIWLKDFFNSSEDNLRKQGIVSKYTLFCYDNYKSITFQLGIHI